GKRDFPITPAVAFRRRPYHRYHQQRSRYGSEQRKPGTEAKNSCHPRSAAAVGRRGRRGSSPSGFPAAAPPPQSSARDTDAEKVAAAPGAIRNRRSSPRN